jgi:hypothetical protein
MPPEVVANPDDKAILDWFAQNDTAQRGVVSERLKAMNTPEATQLLQAMESGGTADEVKAAQDAAVGYVRQKIGERSFSDVVAKRAGAVAAWTGKMTMKAGKGVYEVAKTAVASAKQEFGKKRNAQAELDLNSMETSDPKSPYDNWLLRTSRSGKTLAEEAVDGLTKPSPEQEQSFRRATLYASKLTSLGKRTLGLKASPNTIDFLRDLGYEINDVAEGVALSASVGPGSRASAAPTPGLVRLHRIAKDLRGALGTQVGPALDYLESLADPGAKQVFGDLRDLVKSSSTEGGQLAEQAAREQAADSILALLPRDKFTSIADDENGKMELLDRLVDMQRGHAEPGLRAAIEGALGRDTLNKMMEVVSGIKAPPESDVVIDEPADAMDVKQGEKKFAKAGRSSLYKFAGTLGVRSGKEADVFGETSGTKGKSASQRAELELTGEPGMRRPALFNAVPGKEPETDAEKEVATKIAAAIEALRKEVGYVDEGNTGGFEVEAVTARSIMEDQKMQPGKVLALYRDYLRQDATTKAPLDADPAKAKAQQQERKDAAEKASLVAGLLSRSVDQSKAGKADPAAMKTDTDLQAMMMAEARAYFGERQVVVAKSLTDTDPTRMSRADAMELIEAGKKRLDEARKPGADPATLSRQNVLMFPTGEMKLNAKTGKQEMQYVPVQGSKLVKWVRDQGEQADPKDYSEQSNDERYFADLTEGMVAFIGFGHAVGMPYKLNPNGEQEFFRAGAAGTGQSKDGEFFRDGDDGVPPSLMLPTGEYWETLGPLRANLKAPSKKLSAKGVRVEEDDVANDTVGEDQARNEDPFTVEDRETRDLTEVAAKVRPRRSGKDDKRDPAYAEDNAPELVTRIRNDLGIKDDRKGTGPIRVDVSGQIATEAKTDDPDATEIDFSKGQDPRAEADEITAQNYLTSHLNDKYVAPKSGLAAMSSRRFIADTIKGTMMADEREGDRLAVTMLRTALKPGYKKDERGQKFDAYRVAPLVELISAEGVQAFKRAGATDPLINILTRGILQVLQNPDSNIAESHRVTLAKLIPGIKADTTSFTLQARARALLIQMGGSVTDAEKAVNWGDPSKMAVQPKMAKQVLYEAPKQTIRERVEAKKAEKAQPEAWELSDDELATVGGPEPAKASKTPEPTRKVDEEAVRLARNRMKADGIIPLTEREQEIARRVRNAKAAGGASAPLGKPSGGAKRNRQDARKANGDQTLATGADMAAARLWLDKVAPGMVVNFIKETGYSGEFIEATNTINISTTAAAGILGTAYHEAMHKFWSQFVKSNPKLQTTLARFVDSPKVKTRLTELLEGYPAAQAQLVDGEERLAYAFQFWKAGLLQVDAPTTTIFQKIGALFRRLLGEVRASEHALALFQAFDEGKLSEPSAAGRVIAAQLSKGTGTLATRRRLDKFVQALAAGVLPAEEIMANSVSPEARKLGRTFFSNPGREGDGQGTPGYLNARTQQARKFINRSNQLFENMDVSDQRAVQELMQRETLPDQINVKIHRDAVVALRGLFDEFHAYLKGSGMDIGKIDNYYPTVWDVDALQKNRAKFIKMLVSKHAEDMGAPDPFRAATRIYESLVNRDGVDDHLEASREDGVLAPFFASQEGRTLPWLSGAEKAEYLEKDMVQTITRYFHQGARSAEYHRRFGKNGIFLERSLKKIRVELDKEAVKADFKTPEDRQKWVARQMRDITMSVGAMEGTLGKDISPNMRKFSSWMTVYQNVRLLPMSLFSSFVDPLALVARGAPLQAAYETFVRGISEVFSAWGDAFRDMPKDRVKDEWTALAEHIGATEVAMFNHHMAEQYSSVYMSPGAKKINDAMFRLNGMEAWNKSTRVMATKWAVRFIEKHAALPDKIHSARWLAELGLKPGAIPLNADGNLITDKHELAAAKGIPLPQAAAQMEVIHTALNRWVEGAVLTPNAAQRPAWSSDPNYSVLFHLKQFSYSFHQTILKRAVNEFEHGNLAPVGALAMFIPTMITADIMKGLVQGGGSLPPYMQGYNAGDWFLHGAERAGLAGIGAIGVDASQDIFSLGGPAVEQITDAMVDPSDRTMMKALPLHSLYQYMGGAAQDTPVGM